MSIQHTTGSQVILYCYCKARSVSIAFVASCPQFLRGMKIYNEGNVRLGFNICLVETKESSSRMNFAHRAKPMGRPETCL